ncbi:hypothetical protein BJX64DRAFT_302165 [Aspergillus heterothallicus]
MSTIETTDVLICGCGPTGAMLSCSLGRMGVKHIIIDQEQSITTDPRGIALDEDGIRALQGVGLYNEIYSRIGSCMGVFKFISGGAPSSSLEKAPFASMDYRTSEGGTGHVGFICHKQPVLEECLRGVMAGLGGCDFRPRCRMLGVEEDEEWVEVRYMNVNDKTERRVRARFLVGSDGKTGFTRKKYLEPKGVVMEQTSRTNYEETWVAVNWQITLPTPETHPEFPLWEQGYTPEQVYDSFFPPDFRFLCNPDRPAVCGRFGLREDRLWRFEFVVRKGENDEDEDGEQMATPDALQAVVFPYFRHPASKYGTRTDVAFPEDCIKTLRSRPFVFSARSCNKWAIGRTILCGDSAHVFPPFGGQGITSGFRDATSLAWRLAILTTRMPALYHHTSLLSAWSTERKQQLERSLASTIENGAFVTERNRVKIWLRDLAFAVLRLVPGFRRWFEKGARRAGLARYSHVQGMHFLPEFYAGGKLLPQVYCVAVRRRRVSFVGKEGGHEEEEWGEYVVFSDDVLFAEGKQGIFQVLVLAKDMHEVAEVRRALRLGDGGGDDKVSEWSAGYAVSSEVTFLIHDFRWRLDVADRTETETGSDDEENLSNVVRIASAEEFAQSPLCVGRPPPLYYDAFLLQKEVGRRRFVVVRPDRFIVGAGQTLADLECILREVRAMFHSN